jgi:hypothetical protein
MGTLKYKIHPDPSLMEDIGATSFTVAEAIVELVANSVDARLEDQRLEVEVSVSPGEIRVVDNAKGMPQEILAEAVRLGVKMDQVTGNTKSRKGMFGLGMKTACASLGRYWEVVTRPVGGSKEYVVAFDLAEWRQQAGNRSFEWEIAIEERPPSAGPLGDRSHGTAVIIRELHQKSPLEGPVLAKLGQAYKPHIEEGDRFLVNGNEAKPRVYDYVEESKVEIDVTFGPDDNYHVTGWVALDKQVHNDADYGFNLYREGQLVEAWNKDWFRPHLMTSRIMGEAHLNFVPVNFNKKGFQTQSVEWRLALKEMTEVLKPVVRASREMSRGQKDKGRFARATSGLQTAMGKAPLVGGFGEEESEQAPSAENDVQTTERDTGDSVEVEPNVLVIEGEKVRLTYIVDDFESDQTPWDYIYDENAQELQAVVNAQSRLFEKVKDEAFLGMLALADCVTSFLIRERAFEFVRAREIRDRWLYVSLGEKR